MSAAAAPAVGTALPALEVRGAGLSYGGVRAVDNVDLKVLPGKIVGLIGPNGAGKTSLIDLVTGYARGRGTVTVTGRSLGSLPPHRRARHGMIRTFQGLEIFEDLTVSENVLLGQRLGRRRDDGATQDDVLSLFRLTGSASQVASALPQGGRRLLALARAVACRPTVLIMDEPAAGLDTHQSQELGAIFGQLVRNGVSVLLADHDMSLVLSVCDYIYVMDFGRLIAEGHPDEVRHNEVVRHAYLGA